MLIWKTQNLDSTIASVRYRCMLPSQALEKKGIKSLIYGRRYPLPLHSSVQAIIFVKSFSNDDVKSCRSAHKLRIPIILDLCDNIFVDNYGQGVARFDLPKDNFLEMTKLATAIVTTGPELKCVIEKYLDVLHCPVWIIPDGCETLENVSYSLRVNARKRWLDLLKSNPTYLILEIISYFIGFGRYLLIQMRYQWRRIKEKFAKIKLILKTKMILKKLTLGLEEDSEKEFCSTEERFDRSCSLRSLKKEAIVESNDKLAVLTNSRVLPSDESVMQSMSRQLSNLKKISLKKLPMANQSGPDCQDEKDITFKTILWFGHHGSPYSQSGLINILETSSAIESVSKELPVRLLVVSNNYEKYLDLIDPLPFPTAYKVWHPTEIYRYITESDVVIIPNSKAPFALSKSANRAVLALSLGVPVVATCIPAMQPFKDCILFDNWEENLRKYLSQPELVNNHLKKAQTIINTIYRSEVIAEKWFSLIDSIHHESND